MSYPSPRYLGDSGEVSGLYRWDMGPGPSGPDPHFHKTISESFFMLSGEVRLYDGERWIGATAGDFLYVPERDPRRPPAPRGSPPAGRRVRRGSTSTPALPTRADAARQEAMNEEQRAEFFLRHDTYWV